MEPNFELAILYADEENPGMDKIKSARYLTEAIRTSEPSLPHCGAQQDR